MKICVWVQYFKIGSYISKNEERSEGSNIGYLNQSVGANPPIFRDLNILCDKICNTTVLDLQEEPSLDIYHGEGDHMSNIKPFEMKFELNFGMNENFMEKCSPTTFRWCDQLGLFFTH